MLRAVAGDRKTYSSMSIDAFDIANCRSLTDVGIMSVGFIRDAYGRNVVGGFRVIPVLVVQTVLIASQSKTSNSDVNVITSSIKHNRHIKII